MKMGWGLGKGEEILRWIRESVHDVGRFRRHCFVCFHAQQEDRKMENYTLTRQNWFVLTATATLQWIVQSVWGKVTSYRWQLKKAESQMRVTSSCSAHSPACIINKTSSLLWQLGSCLTFALHSYSQQSHWRHTSQRVTTRGFLKGLNYDEKPITWILFVFYENPVPCLKANIQIDIFHYPKYATCFINLKINAVPKIAPMCCTQYQ